MIKYGLGVILYNPTDNQLLNLQRYLDMNIFEKIYAFDNSKDLLKKKIPITIDYHYMGGNLGLSIPYNIMIKDAIKHDYDFLCIMDQDTLFEKDDICRITRYIDQNLSKLEEVSIVCPNIATNSEQIKRSESQTFVKWTINSASFLNLRNVSKNSLFYDENIFLDGVDYEYCMNIRKHHQKILRIDGAYIVQNFGNTNDKSSFAHHDAIRYYYLSQSRMYMYRKHYGVLGSIYAILLNIRLVFRVLMHEDKKADKTWACLKGMLKW